MRKTAMFSALTVLVLVLSGCVGKQSISLERTGWKLVAWSISSMKADAFEITANFDDKTMSGKSAVNSYSGSYSIDGYDITFGQFVSTEMAGPEDAMRAESNFFELIKQVKTLKVEGIKMFFRDSQGYDLLVFEMTTSPEI